MSKNRSLWVSVVMIAGIAVAALALVLFIINLTSDKPEAPVQPTDQEEFTEENIPTKKITLTDGTEEVVRLGEYVQFGRYYDAPVLWRVIDVDKQGKMMLMSDRILTLKSFDANGDFHKNVQRLKYGSNFYRDSNLRQWLNSSKETIRWSQNRPIAEQVQKNNPYNDEPGFLADRNFTEAERQLIIPRTHEVLLSTADFNFKTGGTQEHILETQFKSSMTNYDKSWFQVLTDQVFLMSVKDLRKFIYDRRSLVGDDYFKAKPTEQAIANSTWRGSDDLNAERNWNYWLRTPEASNEINVRIVSNLGYLYSEAAYNGTVGVRPALILNSGDARFAVDGNGTALKPHAVVVTAKSDTESEEQAGEQVEESTEEE